MLQSIRDRAHGWIAWVIVILIAVPFALWGVQEYLGVDPNVAVAEVNGAEVPLAEYQEAYQRQHASLRAALGESFDSSLLDEGFIRQRTIDSLVGDRLLRQMAASDGLRVSDELLAQTIRQQPSFQRDGRFSDELYQSYLRRVGYSPGSFEESVRENLLREQLATAFVRGAIVSEAEARRLRGLETQRRTFVQAVLPKSRFAADEVPPAEIASYYETNRSRYVSPEQVKVRYVVLRRQALEAQVPVEEGALRNLYQSHLSTYTRPEQRRASHILFTVGGETDEAAALAQAERLRERVVNGEPFADLARAQSQDPGSAERGGDLGFFGRGVMDPAFEAAAFQLEQGQTSAPVRSAFGYHLIQVTEVRPGGIDPFEEVRERVLAEYRGQQAEQLYFEQAEQLSNLTFEQPDSLEVAAETLGLKIEESTPFSRDGLEGDPIFSSRAVLAAAFSEDVLESGNNSDPIELEGGRIVVLRVAERRPSAQLQLSEVRDRIVEELRAGAARRKAEEAGRALLAELRRAAEPQAILAEHGLEWSEEMTIVRQAGDIPGDVRNLVFRIPRPSPGPVYDGLVDESGDFRILRLQAVNDEGNTADTGAAREALAQLVGRSAYDAFLEELRVGAEVNVFQERL